MGVVGERAGPSRREGRGNPRLYLLIDLREERVTTRVAVLGAKLAMNLGSSADVLSGQWRHAHGRSIRSHVVLPYGICDRSAPGVGLGRDPRCQSSTRAGASSSRRAKLSNGYNG